jgi:hypothetical protein
MELVERYLQAVKLALPNAQQEDVIRELSDEILSQVEEKEAALGRPLTLDEQAALLKQIGHPALVAAGYRKQQYLIGPTVFPIYWMILRLILLVALLGMSIAAVAVAATGGGLAAAIGTLARYPFVAISTFAWLTGVFAVLDYFQAKCNFFANWDARTLPKLSKSQQRPSTSHNLTGIVAAAIFGVWWLVALKNQFWLFGTAADHLQLGPVFQTLYPLYVALVLLDVIRHAVALVRPGWDAGRFAFRIVYRATTLLILYFLIHAQDLLVPGKVAGPNVQSALGGINQAIHFGLVITSVIVAAQFAWDLYTHLFRDAGKGQHAVVSL